MALDVNMQYLLCNSFRYTYTMFLVIMQLKNELERITNVTVDDIKSSWSKWASKIYEQARVEASTLSSMSGACAELISTGE